MRPRAPTTGGGSAGATTLHVLLDGGDFVGTVDIAPATTLGELRAFGLPCAPRAPVAAATRSHLCAASQAG